LHYDPVFVVCNARSGSTLLGYLLDSHPDVMCPAEARLIRMAFEYSRSSPAARTSARSLMLDVIEGALSASGKSAWCYKDLDNVYFLDFIRTLFPNAKFICLYRHAMDMTASGLEACRWGYRHYGFIEHVMSNPENLVVALGKYWSERTRMMLDFESRAESDTIRIRYEDIVAAPDKILADLLSFIGVERAAGMDGAILRPRNGDGEDPKIRFKSSVDSGSVGRGRAIPSALLTGELRKQMNGCLSALGYREVGGDWNYSAGSVLADDQGSSPADSRTDLRALVPLLMRARDLPDSLPADVSVSMTAIASDGAAHRWWLDRQLGEWRTGDIGSGVKCISVITRQEVLRDLVLGRLKIDSAIRMDMLHISPQHGADSWMFDKFIGAVFRD
jgi:hypothetical protein